MIAASALLTGCASQVVDAPSLGVRDAESIDPRIPIAVSAEPGPASPALAAEVERLLASARAGDAEFSASVPETRATAAAAGAEESESWVVAQVALARLERMREPVATSAAEIDQILGRRVEAGTLTSGDLDILTKAAAEMRAKTDRQLAIVSDIRAQISR